MTEKDFHNIREFACRNFYFWEDGEDFDWLRKEWHKFEKYLTNEREVEDFILTLAYLYYSFCCESYFETDSDVGSVSIDKSIEDYMEILKSTENPERVKRFFDRTLDILLTVYGRPHELARQFVTIAIGFELHHEDGIQYILELYKDKWKPKEDFDVVPF